MQHAVNNNKKGGGVVGCTAGLDRMVKKRSMARFQIRAAPVINKQQHIRLLYNLQNSYVFQSDIQRIMGWGESAHSLREIRPESTFIIILVKPTRCINFSNFFLE